MIQSLGAAGVSASVRRLFLVVLILLAATLAPLPTTRTADALVGEKPNVLFILTDDMRADDMRYMRYTRRLFEDGTNFTRAIASHPLCCPARAELVTGQYGHNNGVKHNVGTEGGYGALASNDQLLFDWFNTSGYQTTYVGKFLNRYRGGDRLGLTNNQVTIANVYSPWNAISFDGVEHKGHQTPYVARTVNKAVNTAEETEAPFFAWAGFVSPHTMKVDGKWGPPVPPRGYGTFRRSGDSIPPSFSKPSFGDEVHIRTRAKSKRYIQELHSGRVRSLYAVDDAIKSIVRNLKETGEFANTILVFASDNGYIMGEHRLIGKNKPYLDSLRVPLLMRGPGVPDGIRSTVATLVDIPVTLSNLAGVNPTRIQDGADLFTRPQNRAALIQASTVSRGWWWRGVYTRRYTYIRHASGTVEFFDHRRDPYELHNIRRDPRKRAMRRLLAGLTSCSGQECHQTYR